MDRQFKRRSVDMYLFLCIVFLCSCVCWYISMHICIKLYICVSLDVVVYVFSMYVCRYVSYVCIYYVCMHIMYGMPV